MAKVTSTEFAEKWARRMQNATQDIEKGINRVTEAPTAKAARKADKMKANLIKAIDSGKWQAGLEKVTLSDWKNAAIKKGIPRISQGVTEAQPKVAQFAGELLTYQDGLQSEIDSMPDLTLEDSIARMTAWTRGMAKFKKS